MRSRFEAVHFAAGTSLVVGDFRGFGAPFSHHPEFEVVLIVEGEGVRFIHETPEPYAAGELILLGANLPHWWRPKLEGGDPKTERAIVIQYATHIWEPLFRALPELEPIKGLLEEARFGLQICAEARGELMAKMLALPQMKVSEQCLVALEVLLAMEKAPKRRICPQPWNAVESEPRVAQAIRYIQTHYHREIRQEEVARAVGITTVHLSRLFRDSVRMGFSDYLHHLRINIIAMQLLKPKVNIAKCAFENGYQNLSGFNRAFKKIKGMSPREFRKNRF